MTRDDILRLYDQALVVESNGDYAAGELDPIRFAELVAAAERERCAKVCDAYADKALEKHQEDWTKTAAICAALIRGTK